MDNLRLRQRECIAGSEQPITGAERELRSFVGSVIDLLGSEGARSLKTSGSTNWLRWRKRQSRRAPSVGW